MEKTIRHGIIGLGKTVGIAASHIEGLRRNDSLVLTAVYDILPQNARDMLDRMGVSGVTVCQSAEELFSMVDSVSICVPNDQHTALAVEALRHGLHVLVEKPLADSADAALALEQEPLPVRIRYAWCALTTGNILCTVFCMTISAAVLWDGYTSIASSLVETGLRNSR